MTSIQMSMSTSFARQPAIDTGKKIGSRKELEKNSHLVYVVNSIGGAQKLQRGNIWKYLISWTTEEQERFPP